MHPGAGPDGLRLAPRGPELHGRGGKAEVWDPWVCPWPSAPWVLGPETQRGICSHASPAAATAGEAPPACSRDPGAWVLLWTPRLASRCCAFDDGRNRSRVFRGETSKPPAPLELHAGVPKGSGFKGGGHVLVRCRLHRGAFRVELRAALGVCPPVSPGSGSRTSDSRRGMPLAFKHSLKGNEKNRFCVVGWRRAPTVEPGAQSLGPAAG